MNASNPTRNRPHPAKWRLFPAIKTVASYDFLAQHIELAEVDSKELKKAATDGSPQSAIRVLPLLFHEYRHWLDHLCTLWGTQRLCAAFDALNAREQNDPSEFWRVMSFHRTIRKDEFSRYYTTVAERPSNYANLLPWMYQLSCGMRFDAEGKLDSQMPILFTRYAWSDHSDACRVPFSVASLLETGAMSFEVGLEHSLALAFPAGEREVEMRLINEKRLPQLYDPELGVYSTAVHLMANRVPMKAATDAYPFASSLASLCLNLPATMFKRLKIPDEFSKWDALNHAAIEQRDRGYAYLLLAFHASTVPKNDPVVWVGEVARAAGLPALDEILTEMLRERLTLRERVLAGPFDDRFRALFDMGTSMIEKVGVVTHLEAISRRFKELPCPPIVCSDLEWHFLGPTTFLADATDAEKWNMTCFRFQCQCDEFVDACGL